MTFARWLLLPALAGAAMVAGCGISAAPAPAAEDPGPPAQVLTVQQLAAALGCDAHITIKGSDFRQATCTPDGPQIVLLDFDTDQGQREWVDGATHYGGTYLVGNRWVLSGNSADQIASYRKRLGGTLEGVLPGQSPDQHGH